MKKNYIYVLMIIASIIIVVLSLYFRTIDLKDVITGIIALFGTFIGATFAFRLNENKELEELNSKRMDAIRMALFVLIRQHNAIQGMLEEYNKYESPIKRAFNLPAKKPAPYENLMISYTDLDFLLSESDPDFLLRLSIEEERFFQTMESIKIRNEFFVNEVQVEMGRVIRNGTILEIEELELIVGQRIVHGALQSSANAYEFLNMTNESMDSIIKEFIAVAKNIYPDNRFIGYETRGLA